jgi:hypothetical protein
MLPAWGGGGAVLALLREIIAHTISGSRGGNVVGYERRCE